MPPQADVLARCLQLSGTISKCSALSARFGWCQTSACLRRRGNSCTGVRGAVTSCALCDITEGWDVGKIFFPKYFQSAGSLIHIQSKVTCDLCFQLTYLVWKWRVQQISLNCFILSCNREFLKLFHIISKEFLHGDRPTVLTIHGPGASCSCRVRWCSQLLITHPGVQRPDQKPPPGGDLGSPVGPGRPCVPQEAHGHGLHACLVSLAWSSVTEATLLLWK